MKFFAFCIIACLAVSAFAELTDEQKNKVKKASDDCKAESGVDPAYVEKLKTEKVLVEGNDKMNAYCKCMMKKATFINDDNTINKDNIIARIPATADQDKAKAQIEKCSKISEKEATACKLIKCLGENKYHITSIAA